MDSISDSTSTSSINRREVDEQHAAAQEDLQSRALTALSALSPGRYRAGDDLTDAIKRFQAGEGTSSDGKLTPDLVSRMEARAAQMAPHDDHGKPSGALDFAKSVTAHTSFLPSLPTHQDLANVAHAEVAGLKSTAHLAASAIPLGFQPRQAIASLTHVGDSYEATLGVAVEANHISGGQADKLKVSRVEDGYTIEGTLEGSVGYKDGQATGGMKVTFHARTADEAVMLAKQCAKLAADAGAMSIFVQSATGHSSRVSNELRDALGHATSVTLTGALGVNLEAAVGHATGYRNMGIAAEGEVAGKESVELELKDGRPEKITIEQEIEAKGSARGAAGGARKGEAKEFELVSKLASVGLTGSFEATAKVSTSFKLPSSMDLDSLLTEPNVAMQRMGSAMAATRTTSATIKVEAGVTANASAGSFDRRVLATLTFAASNEGAIDEQVHTALRGDVEGALQKAQTAGGGSSLKVQIVNQKESGGPFKLEFDGTGLASTIGAKTRIVTETPYEQSGSSADVLNGARQKIVNYEATHLGLQNRPM